MSQPIDVQLPGSEAPTPATEPAPALGCCSATEQSTCCESSEKSACCGGEATAEGSCGCR